jgi:hypothetical protein
MHRARGQALRLRLVDQIVVNLVPEVFDSGCPFYVTGPLADPILFENPSRVVTGHRLKHLVYDVAIGPRAAWNKARRENQA